jgi:AraC-like DNA-binding protein
MHLLAGTSEPIADIALTCGFCDQSAFTQHFRRHMGLTPAAYRKRG